MRPNITGAVTRSRPLGIDAPRGQRGFGVVDVGQHALAPGVVLAAFVGERDAPRRPIEEAHVERRLERGQRPHDRRQRRAQRLRRGGEAPRSTMRTKVAIARSLSIGGYYSVFRSNKLPNVTIYSLSAGIIIVATIDQGPHDPSLRRHSPSRPMCSACRSSTAPVHNTRGCRQNARPERRARAGRSGVPRARRQLLPGDGQRNRLAVRAASRRPGRLRQGPLADADRLRRLSRQCAARERRQRARRRPRVDHRRWTTRTAAG